MSDDPVPTGDPLPHPAEYHVNVPPKPPAAVRVTGSPGQGGFGLAEAEVGGKGDVVGVSVTDAQDELPHDPSVRT